jgi:tyrosine-protein phosphatase SIW14
MRGRIAITSTLTFMLARERSREPSSRFLKNALASKKASHTIGNHQRIFWIDPALEFSLAKERKLTALVKKSRPLAALPPQNHLPGLGNFAAVSDVLFRGSQPSREGFEQLKTMGIKTIVNLRAYRGDVGKLKGLGFQYVHLRCRAWLPSGKKLAEFLKIVDEPTNRPVFVHCWHGSDRTGLAIASYRIMVQGWALDDAVDELHEFGFHHRVFPQILRYLQRFDASSMQTLINNTDMPPFI